MTLPLSYRIDDGVFNHLEDDDDIVAKIAEYKGEPAIFTSPQVPPDAQLPYIWAPEDVAAPAFDTKTGRGLEVTRDIHVFTANDGTTSLGKELAGMIRERFHRTPFTISSAVVILVSASGPVLGYSDQFIQGRVVTLKIIAMEG